jgi:hypothetical protein
MPEQNVMTAEQQAMMAEWMKYAAPDEHHKALEPLVGKWDVSVRSWMTPDSPANESKGTCEARWILGGRFVQEDMKGDMGGTPYTGLSFTGYDRIRKEYLNVWMDDMSTAPLITRGRIDASGRTLTMEGTYPDATKNMRESKVRLVFKLIDSDRHIFEMYIEDAGGREFRNMEVTYTSRK